MKDESGNKYIFCSIRKRWIVLTEEEWIRQNFIQFLVLVLQYPAAYIAVEKELILNDLKKRFDILVYDSHHQPFLLVECKEPSVAMSESVLQQALRYNMAVPVSYIVLTNGAHTIAWKKEGGAMHLLDALPTWRELGI